MDEGRVEVRHLCGICARNQLKVFEEDVAQSAHTRLPDGAVLDDILDRLERHGTAEQQRQIALMLRVRAEREPHRLTYRAETFLERFDDPGDQGGFTSPNDQ